MMKRTCVLLIGMMFCASLAQAQNYSYYKQMACPDTGLAAQPLDMKKVEEARPRFKNSSREYMSLCDYEQGAHLAAFWSEDLGAKTELCNVNWYKGMNASAQPFTAQGDNQSYRYGLGLELVKPNAQDEWVDIKVVIEGSSAEQAGIVAGSKIYKINKQPVQGLTLAQVVELTKGRVNEEIRLAVVEPGRKRKRTKKVAIAAYKTKMARISLVSPTHFVHVAATFPNNPETFDQDRRLWKAKAIEFVHAIESVAVQCKGYETSNKGPVAR